MAVQSREPAASPSATSKHTAVLDLVARRDEPTRPTVSVCDMTEQSNVKNNHRPIVGVTVCQPRGSAHLFARASTAFTDPWAGTLCRIAARSRTDNDDVYCIVNCSTSRRAALNQCCPCGFEAQRPTCLAKRALIARVYDRSAGRSKLAARELFYCVLCLLVERLSVVDQTSLMTMGSPRVSGTAGCAQREAYKLLRCPLDHMLKDEHLTLRAAGWISSAHKRTRPDAATALVAPHCIRCAL